MNTVWLTALTILAEEGPRNTGPDFGKASPVGLLVVLLLLIATFLLGRSMNRQLRKVPQSFDDPESGTQGSGGGDDAAGRESGGQSPG